MIAKIEDQSNIVDLLRNYRIRATFCIIYDIYDISCRRMVGCPCIAYNRQELIITHTSFVFILFI